MSTHLDRDLNRLEHDLLVVSSLVEEMITNASRSLRERRVDLAEQVIRSDSEVDDHEVQIEEECLKILALHQPVAIDLRRTASVMKINNDLERVADLAVNVAKCACELAAMSKFEAPMQLERMSQISIDMVHGAIDAFVKMDVEAAQRIREADEEMDELNVAVIGELLGIMKTSSDAIEPAMHCFAAARHLERIADHATNVAEDVIYIVDGNIARHEQSGD